VRLRNNGVRDIKKQMESPEDWDWLNDNTIGFSHEKGEIELVTDLYKNRLSKVNTDNNISVVFDKKKDFNPATQKIQNFLKELEETTLALIEAIEERVIEIPSSSNMGTTEQHTRIEFPSECIVKLPIKLVIQIPQQSHSVESELEPAILYIQLTAENFSAEQKRQRLIVPVNEKSEEIIFELTPTEVGEQMVEIEFFHKCSRVGYAIAKTNVKSQAT
jgi:formate dehydrogenase assembly factor FdhD